MKKKYIVFWYFILFVSFCNYGQSGINQSFVIINSGAGNAYYDLQATTANTDFNGLDLGTYLLSNSNTLVLNGAQNKTFKCNTDDITNGFINYRIYLSANPTPPAFIGSEIFFLSNDGTTGCGGTDQLQTWEANAANINILNGLCAGDYALEVYTTADFTFTSGGGGSGTHFANNGAANYIATFTITDDINPTITCPSDITLNNDNNNCSAIVTYNVTSNDNCPGQTIAQTSGLASGAAFPVGTTTNTFVVTDAAGNTETCSFDVTVVDNQDPTITCPSDITLNNDNNNCSAVVTYNVTSNDNCPGQTIAQTSGLASGAAFPVGTTTNTFVVTDAAGNTETCSFDVTVVDNQDPTITCPSDITLNNDNNNCSAVVNYNVTSNDNCPGQTIAQTSGLASGAAFPVGTTTNTFVVTDAAGNTETCSFDITVVDNQDPTITCPSDITLNNDNNNCSAIVTYNVTSNDNCPGQTIAQTSGLASGAAFPFGTTTNTFVVTDAAGNTETCSFDVTVVDNQDPTITCPSDITLNNDNNNCSAVVTYNVTSNDNCPGQTIAQTSGLASGAAFPVGTTTNTFVVTDAAGNTETCSFDVTVVDNQDPTITCPSDITLNNDNNNCSAVVNYNVTSNDNCPGQTIAQTSGLASGAAFPVGTTTNTFVVTDAAGNTETCSFDITVVDNQDPTITCPSDITLNNDNNNCSAIVTYNVTSNDNCPGQTIAQTSGLASGAAFPVGTTTNTFVVTDAAGNTETCSFDVTVVDNQDPTITCPSDITLNNDNNNCSAIVTYNVTSNDNCPGQTIAQTSGLASGAAFPVGTTTNTFVVTDAAGNTETCSFDVTVVDNQDPTITCPSDITLNNDNNNCSAVVTYNVTSNDNCPGQTIAQTSGLASGAAFPVGTTTNTFVVTDAAGNTETCSFDVTVVDNQDPNFTSLPLITAECNVNVPAPSITDNCGGTITGTTSDPTTFSNQGSYGITWTFNDGNGNSIDITQNVIIDDITDPIALCQDLTVQLDNTNGTATISPNQVNNGSSDNCEIANLSLSQSTFDCTNIGSNIVVLTVTDVGGNTDTCTANITVVSPTINGGTVSGYLNNNQTPADADDLVEVTACPDEPQNATFTLTGYTGNIVRWETSLDGGVNWTPISNTTNTYYYADILETTLIRAVIQIGSCQATSTITIVAVIPPDIPPTIIGPSSFDVCLGDNITVEAQSEFGINPNFNNGGMFNQANLNNLGWEVDGAAEMSAGGNNTNNTYWKETNGPKKFNGRCYDSTDNSKFAIVSGIPPYDAPDHTITPLSTLETNVFNTLGLSTATLEFDQAYYLEAGAWCSIELSLDGGITYAVTLDPGGSYNYTGPSDTGFGDVGFNGQCRNSPGTYVDNHVSIDLQNYIGLTNLRIRFTYSGTANSTWAMDNITIPQAPVDEVIEWTDGTGTVVTTGSTTTITPVTPGVQTYGVTSLINGCRSDGDEGTEFIDVSVSFAYAGKDISPIAGECGESTVELNAYDNTLTAEQNITNGAYDNNYVSGTYPGTGDAGVWSVVSTPNSCGGNYSFSNLGDPRATFTGDPGTYTLRWTVAGCSYDDVNVIIDNCNTVDFDGLDDYATFEDNYDRNNNFSFEVWVKPEVFGGKQSILSKRNANNLSTGYDLSLNNNIISFNWNSTGSVTSPFPLTTNRWYHIALTFNSSTYNLYIDGILVQTKGGSLPIVNNNKFLFGAMDQSSNPTHYYNGWMDEIRIWNTALTIDQIRIMMNQEIQNFGNSVRGEIIPIEVSGLDWNNLDGYYRMDLNCGRLVTLVGSANGRLRNMYSSQEETAPLPYTSRVDGQQWITDNTWTHYAVWDAPNSLGIDNSTLIDWNIVQLSHDVDSGDKNITVLGLISDTSGKELTISDPNETQNENNTGQSLTVSHYLKLDGIIDLVGESQLIQNEGSILEVTSSGYLERDQQGTSNLFNYNYWSSPVGPINTISNNANYTVNDVFRDGTDSNNPLNFLWTNSYDANGSTTPKTLSRRWLYVYENYPADTYAAWRYLTETGTLSVGLGYTFKGSGASTSEQNYVYLGKPNNGTISTPVTIGNQALVGNPYPSSIDAYEFILDNLPLLNPDNSPSPANPNTSESINGTLYFWEHYSTNFTHILEEYEGGYATYNLTGGNAAVSPPLVSGNGSPSKIPGRYVPVAQGFYVTSSDLGGDITFSNDQRQFVREATNTSVFLRLNNEDSGNNISSTDDIDQSVQRVRLDFKNPDGAIRPLLLGFVPDGNATDGFDFGYDAEVTQLLDNDMVWMVGEIKCSTQGVGPFDISKQYPLGLFMTEAGSIEVSLNTLENFNNEINIYIYDSLSGAYFSINDEPFEINLEPGEFTNRFYITFQNNTLTVNEFENDGMIINFLSESQYIYVKTINGLSVDKIELYNILGQKVRTWLEKDNYSSDSISLPVFGVSQGTYIVKVYSDNKVFNKKIIINQ